MALITFYRLLFIKFLTNEARTKDTTENCGGYCPRIKVIVLTGDRSKGDCQQTAYTNPGNYKKPFKVSYTLHTLQFIKCIYI